MATESHANDAELTWSDVLVSAVAETLEYGVVLVDQCASVLFTNSAARQFFDARRLIMSGGMLRAPSAAETRALHEMIMRCAQWHSGKRGEDALAFCRVGRPQLSLQIVPVVPRSVAGGAAARRLVIIFIADPAEISPPGPPQLRHHFGLTAAEAIVASQILRGRGLKACAALLGIAEPTARTHLRRIFEKTGTKRQADLVRLIYASRLAVRSPDPDRRLS